MGSIALFFHETPDMAVAVCPHCGLMLVEMPPLRTLLQAAHGAEQTRERLFPSQSCLVARVPSLVLGPGPPVPTRDRVPWLSEVWGGGVRTLHLDS